MLKYRLASFNLKKYKHWKRSSEIIFQNYKLMQYSEARVIVFSMDRQELLTSFLK